MRLGYSKSKNAISYYVYKTGYKNGKNTTVMVEKLGTDSQIREKYGVEDAEQWARAYIDELNRKEAEEKAKVMVTFSPAASPRMSSAPLMQATCSSSRSSTSSAWIRSAPPSKGSTPLSTT